MPHDPEFHDLPKEGIDPLLDLTDVNEDDREPLDPSNPEHKKLIDAAWDEAIDEEGYRIEVEQLYALGELAKTDWPPGVEV